MRVVLDTKVLASGLLSRAGIPGELLLLWTYGRFTLLLSQHILNELARTLQKPYFRQRLTPAQLSADVALLQREGILVPLTVTIHGVASHPQDDLVLATALSGQADYLVTGDRQLQQLGAYQGVRLLSPRAFHAVLSA